MDGCQSSWWFRVLLVGVRPNLSRRPRQRAEPTERRGLSGPNPVGERSFHSTDIGGIFTGGQVSSSQSVVKVR
jgi:hypothetical protein